MSALDPVYAAARTVDKDFNVSDADLVLACTQPGTSSGENSAQTSSLHIFKVHKSVLAAPSTFFEAVMEASEPENVNEKDSEEDLPTLKMEENVAVVRVLLGAAYNKPHLLAPLLESRRWEFALDVWEASNKYCFHVLKALSSSAIQLSSSMVDDEAGLAIYTRASMFDDQALAQLFVEKASYTPPYRMTTETLHQLPAKALSTLLLRHKEKMYKELEPLLATSTTHRCHKCLMNEHLTNQDSSKAQRIQTFKQTYFGDVASS